MWLVAVPALGHSMLLLACRPLAGVNRYPRSGDARVGPGRSLPLGEGEPAAPPRWSGAILGAGGLLPGADKATSVAIRTVGGR